MASSTRFGVFSLSADAPVDGPGVDDRGRAIRRRRFHAKSRDGCLNCKSRKVKCDEHRPTCRKCSKRGLRCDFDPSAGERELTVVYRDAHNQRCPSSGSSTIDTVGARRRFSGDASSELPVSSIGELGVPVLDLESLQLMHHFEHFTSGTLMFEQHLWRDQILPLAFQNEYLMHAVLTVSASHLHYLQPHTSRYSQVAAIHLDRSLSGFRESLNHIDLPHQNPDIIMACGFLLLHYAWSVPFFNVPNDRSPDIESDGLLWFAGGVKAVILAVYMKDGKPVDGIFQRHITTNHSRRFYEWSDQADCSYDFEQNFFHRSPPSRESSPDGYLQDYATINAEERLVPIFHTADAVTRGQDISDLMPSVLAYTLMWPSKAMANFEHNVRDGNIDAMVTMLSFYASSWLVVSERAWWAYYRPKIMCKAILEHLSRERPSQWDHNIAKITEYFGFNRNCDGSWEIGSPTIGHVA